MAEATTYLKDYISGLPDELLYHILALLPSTKDAIRTSVLSKRWEQVWTHVPSFIFDCHQVSPKNVAACLNRTLSLYSPSKVEKLFMHLGIMDARLLGSRMEPWLSSAGDLILFLNPHEGQEVGYENGYFLPESVYQNSCLLKLETEHCQFVPNGRVSWELLKDLNIGYATLADELLQNILQGTPQLHVLKFYSCRGFQRIDLSSNTHLKKLVIEDYYAYNEPQLHISGPYLEDLEILGIWIDMKCSLMDMPRLIRATIDFAICEDSGFLDRFGDYQNMIRNLVDNVGHVQQLKLGDWCVQVLSTLAVDYPLSTLRPSTNRICLILEIGGFDVERIPGIENLLLSSRELKKLVVNFGSASMQLEADEEIPENYWSSHTGNFNCLEFHLKTIEISGFPVRELSSDDGIEFLEFLLGKAKVLERMVIHGSNDKLGELLSPPGASPSAMFLLE